MNAVAQLLPPSSLRRKRRDPDEERARTLSIHTLRYGATKQPPAPYPEDVDRPYTRGECAGGFRPCPFVSCKYHLYLDVTVNGGIKLNFPQREVWELRDSCALDVADGGAATLDRVAVTMNVTRERVRQIEHASLTRCLTPATLYAGNDNDMLHEEQRAP